MDNVKQSRPQTWADVCLSATQHLQSRRLCSGRSVNTWLSGAKATDQHLSKQSAHAGQGSSLCRRKIGSEVKPENRASFEVQSRIYLHLCLESSSVSYAVGKVRHQQFSFFFMFIFWLWSLRYDDKRVCEVAGDVDVTWTARGSRASWELSHCWIRSVMSFFGPFCCGLQCKSQ